MGASTLNRGTQMPDAGWCDDPTNEAEFRWWTGTRWISQTAAAKTNPPPPPGESATVEAPSPTAVTSDSRGPQLGSSESPPWYRQLEGWRLWTALGVALLVGIGIGAAGGSQDELDAKQGEIDSLQANVDSLTSDLDAALGERDAALGDVDGAMAEADQARKDARQDLAYKEADLQDREDQLDQRANELDQTEDAIAANSFNDGIWQASSDFEAGLYRAPGGSLCYWAKLNSADTTDIASNGLGKNPTVEIDTPFFETSDCGEWTKIG